MVDFSRLLKGAATSEPTVYEFFAGIGLVRLGLESAGFKVRWSNDLDPSKYEMYRNNFGYGEDGHEFVLGDIAEVNGGGLFDPASLAWASFPCTDLSLAGWGRGIETGESATFWHFTRILEEAGVDRPPVIALENVTGLATNRGGEDLVTAVRELNRLGYSVDVLTLDARRFVPQSRPRVFLVGAINPPKSEDISRNELRPEWLQFIFEDPSLVTHRAKLPTPPAMKSEGLSDVLEKLGSGDSRWWDEKGVDALVESLSPLQRERLDGLNSNRRYSYRTAYRRTRNGKAVWEIRADEIAGCLRTARGGSSKQAVVRVGRGTVRARWMTPTEYARLMGAGSYNLDGLRPGQALFGFGDAVCVSAVQWLAQQYLLPLMDDERVTRSQRVLASV